MFAADTDEAAQLIATSMQQAFVNLRSGRPARLQPPVRDYLSRLAPAEAAMLEQVTACTAIGSAGKVRQAVEAFIARTGIDELIDRIADLRPPRPVAVLRDHRRFVAVRFSGGKFAPSCF